MATKCNLGILQDIVSSCSSVGVGGNEATAWIFNRNDFAFTYDASTPNLITNITVNDSAVMNLLKGVPKTIDSGHDITIEDGQPTQFTHMISFNNYSFKASNVSNIDNIKDVVVVVESKDKQDDGDGVFRVYGAKYGLDVSSDTHRANTGRGVRALELSSRSGDGEPYSSYTLLKNSYTETKLLLEVLSNTVDTMIIFSESFSDLSAWTVVDTTGGFTLSSGKLTWNGMVAESSTATLTDEITNDTGVWTIALNIEANTTVLSLGYIFTMTWDSGTSNNRLQLYMTYPSVDDGNFYFITKNTSAQFSEVVTSGDVLTSAGTGGSRFKIVCIEATSTVNFYEWVGSTWVLRHTSNSSNFPDMSSGSLQLIFNSNNGGYAGLVKVSGLYVTDEDYSTEIPA